MAEFLQLLGVVVPVCAVVIVAMNQNKKLYEVHVQVNFRLSEAIAEIAVLKEVIRGLRKDAGD